MKYYKSTVDAEILSTLKGINIEKHIVEMDGWKISIFISFFENQNVLKEIWEDISSALASTFQANLKGKENQFEKWNIYIIYVCKGNVDKELKNKIETNKFSNRKIVEDNFSDKVTEEKAIGLIIKHITNTDLQAIVDNTKVVLNLYEPNNHNIWDLMPKSELISGNTDLQKNILQQLKNIPNED